MSCPLLRYFKLTNTNRAFHKDEDHSSDMTTRWDATDQITKLIYFTKYLSASASSYIVFAVIDKGLQIARILTQQHHIIHIFPSGRDLFDSLSHLKTV